MTALMRVHFAISFPSVALFVDPFDPLQHDSTHHALEATRPLFPDAMRAIARLPSGTIFEVFSVGIPGPLLGDQQRPAAIVVD